MMKAVVTHTAQDIENRHVWCDANDGAQRIDAVFVFAAVWYRDTYCQRDDQPAWSQ